jgi:hypothetical protein
MSGLHYSALQRHLFPGDGLEAVAFALCGRHRGQSAEILMVQRIIPVRYEDCQRAADRVTWLTDALVPIMEEARHRGLAIVKFHSHTGAYDRFSDPDDDSDRETFSSVSSWLDTNESHGSAIMLPDGRVFGRVIREHTWEPFDMVTVVGDDLFYWRSLAGRYENETAFERQAQLFGPGTTERLRSLRVGVVGCSGTGSPTIELLTRLGVGTLVLVDHDLIEDRNLNRITNARKIDVGRAKVLVLAEAVRAIGLGTEVVPLEMNLFKAEAVRAIAECDVVFGCMDTAEGRHLLNRIATFYLLPYFDLGVHLRADGNGGIDEASGVVHYVKPGGSSLFSRGAYGMRQVEADNRRRTNSETYERDVDAGYIEGVTEGRPSVVSVNTTIASLAVNEFLARIHPFRSCANVDGAVLRMNFMEAMIMREEEGAPCELLARHVGRGDIDPLLDWPGIES